MHHESITRLGPDALKYKFDMRKAKNRLKERKNMKLADLLLDQTFVVGSGNKYKSEILGHSIMQIVFHYLSNRGY